MLQTRVIWRASALFLLLAACAAHAQQLKLPDTPAGRALSEWLEAFNSADPNRIAAFNQRDWVVMGDLNNLTDQSRLTNPLEAALRIGLQQSKYVNLVSDARVN